MPDTRLILKKVSDSKEIPLAGTMSFGRTEQNTVRLIEGSPSRHHAEISVDDNTAFVQDVGSTNGTFVNGRRIDPHIKVKLASGDRLKFDIEEFVFRIERPAPANDPDRTVFRPPSAAATVLRTDPPAPVPPAAAPKPVPAVAPAAPVVAAAPVAAAAPAPAPAPATPAAPSPASAPPPATPARPSAAVPPAGAAAASAAAPVAPAIPAAVPPAAPAAAPAPPAAAPPPALAAAPAARAPRAPAPAAAEGGPKPPPAWIDDPNAARTIFIGTPRKPKAADGVTVPELPQPQGDTPCLIITNGARIGERVDLLAADQPLRVWKVGSQNARDVCLTDPGVSALHATLKHENGTWLLTDDLSANGTFVNDAKILKSYLSDGDRIRFGPVDCVFRLPAGAAKSGSAGGSRAKRVGLIVAVAFALTLTAIFIVLRLFK